MWKRIVSGTRLGMICAGSFSLVAIGIYVLGGSAPFAHYHTTLLVVIAVYEISGMAGGAIVALLRPLLPWRLGAAAVGIVAAMPFAVGIRVSMDGLSPMTRDDWFVFVEFTLTMGLLCGYFLYRVQRDMHPTQDTSARPHRDQT